MITEIQTLLDQYSIWLRDKTALRPLDDWVEITTPFLDRNNDYMQIYAKKEPCGYLLTDDGYVLGDLEQSGCRLDTPKRQALLRSALNGFGVQLHADRIEVRATRETFALRKHSLIQAMLAVNDLFYLASPLVTSFFFEDVVAWLDRLDIRYTPRAKFTGKSGYDHQFDFVIPKSKNASERLIQTVSKPTGETARALAFGWIDTKEVRSADSRAYALLNDTDHTPSAAIMEALRSYDVKPVAWSGREEIHAELAA